MDAFSAAGQVASAAIQANAVSEATNKQIAALEKQRQFVYDQLEPEKIGGAAKQADVDRAQARLALQSVVDPELLNQRYASQAAITKQLQDITSGNSPSDQIAKLAASEAAAGGSTAAQGKQALIDAALKEISSGATIPPDLQQELIRSGLEKSGSSGSVAGGTGLGGQILHNVVGSAGLALRQKRLETAAGLLGQAQNLEQSRASILGTLFPNLNVTAQNNLKASQGVLAQSNQMVPEAGLGGSDIANIWLARVGATNQLAQSAADAAARGGMANAQIWGNAMGNAIPSAAKAIPSIWGAITGGGGGGGGANFNTTPIDMGGGVTSFDF